MALSASFYYSSCQNLLTIFADDDPTGLLLETSTESGDSFIPISQTLLPIPGLSPALVTLSTNENFFKQFMRAYLAA